MRKGQGKILCEPLVRFMSHESGPLSDFEAFLQWLTLYLILSPARVSIVPSLLYGNLGNWEILLLCVCPLLSCSLCDISHTPGRP